MADDKPTIFQRIDNFVRGAANGMTFGAADYIAGVADTLVSGGSVKENIGKELDRTNNGGAEMVVGTAAGALAVGVGAASSYVGGIGRICQSYQTLKREQAVASSVAVLLDIDKTAHAISEGAVVGSAAASASFVTSDVSRLVVSTSVPPPTSTGAKLPTLGK